MGYVLLDASGKQIPIGLSMRIGSDPANDIVLNDPRVSAFHAILGELPDGLLIRNEAGSPIFIDDQEITGTTRLKQSDILKMGSSKFVVSSTEPILPDIPEGETSKISEPAGEPIPPVNEPPATIKIPPAPPAATESARPAPGKVKKSGGCLKWGLTIFLVLILACVFIGAGSYLLVKNGVIPQRMVDTIIGGGDAQITVYNFTDKTIYFKAIEIFEDENTITMPSIFWTLPPYESKSDLSYSGTGRRETITIGTVEHGDDLGSCVYQAQPTDNITIVILPEKVLIDNVQYPEFTDKPPVSGRDLILATTSLCEKQAEN